MANQSLIQIRVDQTLKDEVNEIFTSLGLDVSTAIRIFLQRCRVARGIPFALTVESTPPARMGILKGKYNHDLCWYDEDRKLDAELERDFYGNSL